MSKNKTDKAVAYAYRLFSIRPRSEKEIEDRLFRKGFNRVTAREAVSLLKEKHIIDDFKFAKSWVESRSSTNPKGVMLLRKELWDKGISNPIIEKVLSDSRENENSALKTLALQRMERLKGSPKMKAKKKLFDFLARRGFSFDAIEDVIKEIFGS